MTVEQDQIKFDFDGTLMLQDTETGKVVRRSPGMPVYWGSEASGNVPSGIAAMDMAFRELERQAWRGFIDGVIVGAVCMSLIWMWLLA